MLSTNEAKLCIWLHTKTNVNLNKEYKYGLKLLSCVISNRAELITHRKLKYLTLYRFRGCKRRTDCSWAVPPTQSGLAQPANTVTRSTNDTTTASDGTNSASENTPFMVSNNSYRIGWRFTVGSNWELKFENELRFPLIVVIVLGLSSWLLAFVISGWWIKVRMISLWLTSYCWCILPIELRPTALVSDNLTHHIDERLAKRTQIRLLSFSFIIN